MKNSADYRSRFRILKGEKISLVVSALLVGSSLVGTNGRAMSIDIGQSLPSSPMSFTNPTGTTVSASGANTIGIDATNMTNSDFITNNGAVASIATDNNLSKSISSVGISTGSLSNTASMTNTGVITTIATATNASSAYARGISVGTLSGTTSITNSGTITATASNSSTNSYATRFR